MITRAKILLQALFSANAVDDRVRKTLVNMLYARPLGMIISAICAIVTAQVAAYSTHVPAIAVVANALTGIALLRIAMARFLPLVRKDQTSFLECAWETGAYSFALSIGLLAAFSIAFAAPVAVQLLTVCNATAYSVGIAARNGGRPLIAIGQTVLGMLPVALVLAFQHELPLRMLSFTMFLTIPAMTLVSLNVFRVVRDSIAAAETSAQFADRMQQLARTDVVTGLHNRAGLNFHLSEYVGQLPAGRSMALIWLDLDRFKEVNDLLGHRTGDKVLAEVSERLRGCARAGAVLGRFGSDEFVIACEARDRRDVDTIARALLDEVIRPIRVDEHRLEVGCSIGIAMLPDDGEDLEALLRGADLALYHAKINGRNQVSFFAPAMTRDLMRRREIEADLRLALQRDELSIYFQPIVDLATGRIRAFEALVRWFHPEKGELKPDEFIPVAEESGAIITLGNWITAQAAKTAAQWPDDITVSVNISPLQIKAPGAALGILNALREARLPPHRLELEITETVLLDHGPQTDDFIAELSAAGVRFALDDFGTGYSSLSYLGKYHFGKIKVDRSFVSGPNAGRTSDAIIHAVSEMASRLNMEIVAEGLETVEQVRAVSAAGCTLGQGFYFSRAVPDYLAGMLLAQEREKLNPRRAVG